MARLRAQIDQRRRAGPSDSDVLVRYRPIPRDLKKAIDYIRDHLSGKMSVTDLVAHCGVPERTLRKHFRTFMAASPLKYWRQLRLAGVRACLLEGSDNASITEVAIRFGFSHFGRFAQDYRYQFGETPSVTLQRSRIGEITSHRAVTTVNVEVASKVSGSEGRARNRRVKAAWGAEI